MIKQSSAPVRGTIGNRLGASRKLLERKAAERALEAVAEGEGIEAHFPAAEGSFAAQVEAKAVKQNPFSALHDTYLADRAAERDVAEAGQGVEQAPEPSGYVVVERPDVQPAAQPASAPAGVQPTAPAASPVALPAWSDEDESAYQALLAKRTAAGRGQRGRAVADQFVGLGAIKPNPNTVVAVLVSLVAERGGSVRRDELVTAMAGAAFPHGKVRSTDRTWCQGYIAGAVRNGFLTATTEPVALPAAA